MVLFVITVFLSVALFGLGLASRATKSELLEKLEGGIVQTNKKNIKDNLKIISNKTVRLANSLGLNTNLEALDKKLYLAGQPFNLTAEEFLGVMSIIVSAALIIFATLWMGGILPPFLCFFSVFAIVAVPIIKISGEIEKNREKLGNDVVDLCNQLELATSAGLHPQRVISWTSEGDSVLAGILKDLKREVEMGKQLNWLFNRLAEDYDISEAKEMALALKHAEVQGVSITQHLRELSKDFRNRREYDMETKVAKIKPGITTILVVSVLISSAFLMLGPVIADNLENFRSITQF